MLNSDLMSDFGFYATLRSLEELPEDIVDGLYEGLFQQLRTKLNDALLAVPEIHSPDQVTQTVTI